MSIGFPKPPRTPRKARKPLPPSSSRPPRTAPPKPRNTARKNREWTRAYGSAERVAFINTLPCVGCGVVGYSENAHVGKEGAGSGRKANADQIVPLCGPHGDTVGCHKLFDRFRFPFDRAHTRIPVIRAKADTQKLWLAFSGGAENEEET